jgi:probable rRNA maturation factor
LPIPQRMPKHSRLPVSRISLSNNCPNIRVPASRLASKAGYLLKKESPGTASVNVIFVDNRYIRKLNARFRKKNKATDVLSFAFNDPDLLGEVYISLERARAQAREYGATLPEEVWRLVVHGLLHLMGHTHYRKKERTIMQNLESSYL